MLLLKNFFLHLFYYTAFQLPKLNLLYVAKQWKGFAKTYLSSTISLYQGTKIALKNGLFFKFFF